MSGLTGAINTALSGILAFETGISTVSQNLANQTTAGYAVETVNTTTAATAAGQPGAGVQPPQIQRAASGFSAGLLRVANSANAAASTQSAALTNISDATQNNGDVQSALNQFFLDVGTLAANPTSAGQRQTVLSDANVVAGAFQSSAGAIADVQAGAVATVGQSVSTANGLLAQLSNINHSLAGAPNDNTLLDQQAATLNTLSTLIPVSVLPQSDGQVLLTSGGTVLLDQTGAQTLTLNGGGSLTATSVSAGAGGAALHLAASDGTIGGSIAAWQAGAQALQGLNAQAAAVATAVNASQAEGLTSAGQPGTNLFTVPAPTAVAATSNTGSASLTAQITSSAQLSTDGGPYTLLYKATTGWTATDQASQQSTILGNGNSLAFAGLTVNVAGTPASGDQFVLNPAPGAAAAVQVALTNPNGLAAADPYVATPGNLQNNGSIINSNAGNPTSGADSVTASPASGAALVPASYYGTNLQLTFSSASAYTVSTSANPSVAIATGTYTAGSGAIAVAYPAGSASGQYWQLSLGGTPAAGDVVTLQPGGSSSGSNATRLAALWTAPNGSPSGTMRDAVVNLGTGLGAQAQQAQQQATATAAQVTTATANLQSISGVSVDQQATVLTGYSQAYQAVAQVIATAHSMFESLLQAV